MIKQLIHKGILIPTVALPAQLVITVRGKVINLNPLQMEMAIAWAKKQGTPYVEDKGFVDNFMRDFSSTLGMDQVLTVADIDFGPVIQLVQAEREAREKQTKEDKKALAALRKAEREKLKEEYGFATVDGERVELAGYLAEPSSIFMGRGTHPMRGKWKQGPVQSDITLNLSPDAPVPAGSWAAIIWEPESLWVARWIDKLAAKIKYVWLHDTAQVKQEREAKKFDKAVTLEKNIRQVREMVKAGLASDKEKERMVATVCSLIDTLCLRVGDEKDSDEADTVGATTLRPEHIILHPDDMVEFKFLGKDSVLWHKTIKVTHAVWKNLESLIARAQAETPPQPAEGEKIQIFKITSGYVNDYLGGALKGLTAKVFRTHHATLAVQTSLKDAGVRKTDPEYRKWSAVANANLKAAELCNHYKTAPANWEERRVKAKQRQSQMATQIDTAREGVTAAGKALAKVKREADEKQAAAPEAERAKLAAKYVKKIAAAEKKAQAAQLKLNRAGERYEKTSTKEDVASRTRTWNLGTSLKSYIDPRVFQRWGSRVGFDVLGKYYPATLQRKFAWAKETDQAKPDEPKPEETDSDRQE